MFDPVVSELVRRQVDEGLSDKAFATKLGIDRAWWGKVRRGIWPGRGWKLRTAAVRVYPELRDIALETIDAA